MAATKRSGEHLDQRSAPRYVLPLPITVHRTVAPESDPLSGTIRNISVRGVFFTTDQNLRVGAVLNLEFVLPEEITNGPEVLVRARSRVLRSETETGDELVGVAAVFENYEIVTTKPDHL